MQHATHPTSPNVTIRCAKPRGSTSTCDAEAAMKGRNVLVVGASSGIGAAFARAAAAAGANVTIAARRRIELDALIGELGSGHAIAGDASDATDARRIADFAAEQLGGIDLLLYAAGYGVLQRIEKIDPDVWLDIYRVNVIGANLVTAAALPHMHRGGVCAFLSSRTVEDTNALFSSYAASKAALDQCVRTWRVEHPERRFVRVVMGNCQPTGFADHMGSDDMITDALVEWERQAIPGGLMHVDAVGRALVDTLRVTLDHPEIDSSEIKFDARTV
jgi:NAD(P)-dependent dehydrogenase (short-subunit alcohol dehydrogenase family)